MLIIGGLGYIGSRLAIEFEADVLDLEWFKKPTDRSIKLDYGDIAIDFFKKFDTIILLAGHSSVAMANIDPMGAYHNNIVNFQRLIASIPDETKLIYASSSSVYNGIVNASEYSHLGRSTNVYDYTKSFIDNVAQKDFPHKKTYGLRFGTVNGPSPSFRPELMINKMYYDATHNGYIEIYGENIERPILDIEDLVYAIKMLTTQEVRPGIYNVSSFNDTVGNMANIVASMTGVPVFSKGESKAYDFSMINDKLKNGSDWRPLGSVESIVSSMFGMDDFGIARDNVSAYKNLQSLWQQ